MKKDIYNLFTRDNGVILPMSTINYLEDKINTMEELECVFNTFKSQFDTSTLTIAQVDAILQYKLEMKKFYLVKEYKFKHRNLSKELEAFKNKINIKTTPVSMAEVGVECTIFGIFYKNRFGFYVLEDDYDTIEVNLENIKNNGFLFDGMFVGMKGVKEEQFKVNEVILPEYHVFKNQNKFLEQQNIKICVFSALVLDIKEFEQILKLEKPDLCVLFTNNSYELSNMQGLCKHFIVAPVVDDPDFLTLKHHNLYNNNINSSVLVNSTSNPFTIETFESSVGFICAPVFKQRQHGLFFNQKPMESFIKSILSQQSLFPFTKTDFSTSEFPNICVFLQDFHPLVLDIDTIKVLSLPGFESGYYAVLDYQANRFEIKLSESIK